MNKEIEESGLAHSILIKMILQNLRLHKDFNNSLAATVLDEFSMFFNCVKTPTADLSAEELGISCIVECE